jgi:hypothetical protein
MVTRNKLRHRCHKSNEIDRAGFKCCQSQCQPPSQCQCPPAVGPSLLTARRRRGVSLAVTCKLVEAGYRTTDSYGAPGCDANRMAAAVPCGTGFAGRSLRDRPCGTGLNVPAAPADRPSATGRPQHHALTDAAGQEPGSRARAPGRAGCAALRRLVTFDH